MPLNGMHEDTIATNIARIVTGNNHIQYVSDTWILDEYLSYSSILHS